METVGKCKATAFTKTLAIVLWLPICVAFQSVMLFAAPVSLICMYLIVTPHRTDGSFTWRDTAIAVFFVLALWYYFFWLNND